VTLTFLGWGPATPGEVSVGHALLDQFTARTRIPVKFIPAPSSVTRQLELMSRYLDAKASPPDVYLLDVILPPVLGDRLLDLEPYLGGEARHHLRQLLQSDEVDGRLVAMPFEREAGLLYYRADLLRKYGYSHPPDTWDELESMAARIQAGERRAGHQGFWGYAWQGAPYEGLTCDALEWQASSGGGHIIESDGTISVNNARTIRALERARRWVGTISPPGVVAYLEEDSENLWLAGKAAFTRDWIWPLYRSVSERGSPLAGEVGVATLPGGEAGRVAVNGTTSLAVSRYTRHPREAAQLVGFLTSHDAQSRLWTDGALPPTREEFYQGTGFMRRPDQQPLRETLTSRSINRPIVVTGARYGEVSRAYYTAVHSVLTGEARAKDAVAGLETELVRITGLKAGPPPPLAPPPASDD
jgi:trehalose/maltose transport system substrate-binding protein